MQVLESGTMADAGSDRMREVRAFLAKALTSAAGGKPMSEQDMRAAIPDPGPLGPDEKAAWVQLRFWPEDEWLRASSAEFARFSLDRTKELATRLLNDAD